MLWDASNDSLHFFTFNFSVYLLSTFGKRNLYSFYGAPGILACYKSELMSGKKNLYFFLIKDAFLVPKFMSLDLLSHFRHHNHELCYVTKFLLRNLNPICYHQYFLLAIFLRRQNNGIKVFCTC